MKEIANYRHNIEAHFARTRLENAGIRAVVVDEASFETIPLLGGVPGGGVKLAVAEEDAERAIAIIHGEPVVEKTLCPQCGSGDVTRHEQRHGWLLANLLIALRLNRRKLTCNHCGWKWRAR